MKKIAGFIISIFLGLLMMLSHLLATGHLKVWEGSLAGQFAFMFFIFVATPVVIQIIINVEIKEIEVKEANHD